MITEAAAASSPLLPQINHHLGGHASLPNSDLESALMQISRLPSIGDRRGRGFFPFAEDRHRYQYGEQKSDYDGYHQQTDKTTWRNVWVGGRVFS